MQQARAPRQVTGARLGPAHPRIYLSTPPPGIYNARYTATPLILIASTDSVFSVLRRAGHSPPTLGAQPIPQVAAFDVVLHTIADRLLGQRTAAPLGVLGYSSYARPATTDLGCLPLAAAASDFSDEPEWDVPAPSSARRSFVWHFRSLPDDRGFWPLAADVHKGIHDDAKEANPCLLFLPRSKDWMHPAG
jgi:hypothetical protein